MRVRIWLVSVVGLIDTWHYWSLLSSQANVVDTELITAGCLVLAN